MDNRYYTELQGGAKVSFDSLAEFPCRPLDHVPTDEDWAKVPAVTSFCLRGSLARASTSDISAQYAVAQGRLYVRCVCRTHSKATVPMRGAFSGWCFDNSAEIKFANCQGVYHFQVNANGAISRFRQGDRIQDVQVSGQNGPGGWTVLFSAPQEQIFLGLTEAAFQVTAYDMDTVMGAQYFDCCVKKGCFDEGVVFGRLVITATGEPSPAFLPEAYVAPDMKRLKQMTESVCRHYPQYTCPAMDTDEQIRGAAHDVGMMLKPVRQAHPTVDFAQPDGTIRRLYGVNLGPEIAHQGIHNLNALYRKLGASSMRPHDAVLSNPGSRIVDTIFVFPLEHLDPHDPANYYFDQTDYYLQNTLEQGPEIYYRLGVSIDHAKKKFTARAPRDFQHYAEVCAGIVRHYNCGWGNGFHWNIKYWEFWNEPESLQMWDKSMEEFFDLFILVGKRLKAEFPDIKFGGPGAMSLSMPLFLRLAERCKASGFVPDFISWHQYSSNMEGLRFQPIAARAFVDSLGWDRTEIHLTEWHYITKGPGSNEGIAEMRGVDSAAFTAAVIAGWQDTPMDLSHFYTAGKESYGCFDRFSRTTPLYYGMCAVGELQNKYNKRIKCSQGPGESYCIAGQNDSGESLILYSVLKTPEQTLTIELANLPSGATVKSVDILDESHPVPEKATWTLEGNALQVSKTPGSALVLVYL